jgi:hypothetical protein
MNERIQQLAEQAGFLNKDEESIGYFAELIVKECIQAVKNVGGYNEDYHMNAIKKYFGVEE